MNNFTVGTILRDEYNGNKFEATKVNDLKYGITRKIANDVLNTYTVVTTDATVIIIDSLDNAYEATFQTVDSKEEFAFEMNNGMMYTAHERLTQASVKLIVLDLDTNTHDIVISDRILESYVTIEKN